MNAGAITRKAFVGQPLRRREDMRFVHGKGRYVDDVALPGTAWCAFVRSPHAHARIRCDRDRGASRMPGVLLTLTAADWDSAPVTANSPSCIRCRSATAGR